MTREYKYNTLGRLYNSDFCTATNFIFIYLLYCKLKKTFMNKFRLDFKISITQKCHHCIHNLHFTLKYNLYTYSNIVAWDWTGQATLLQFCGKYFYEVALYIFSSYMLISLSLYVPSKTIVKVYDRADSYLIRGKSIRLVLSVIIC